MKTFLDLLIDKFGLEKAVSMNAMRQVIWEMDKFEPTEAQKKVIWDGKLMKLVAGGVRAGKSRSVSRMMDWHIGIPGGLIWIIGPDFGQTRAEFDYMRAPWSDAGLISDESVPKEPNRSRYFVVEGGARVETKSSIDLTKIASFAPTGILVVEAAQIAHGILSKVLERGVENDAYIVFSGTLEGSKDTALWFQDLFLELQKPDNGYGGRSYSLSTYTNTVIFPLGADDPKFKRLVAGMTPDEYAERIEARPYKPSGLIFKDFEIGRHVMHLEPDQSAPIELAIDPGTHCYAVLFVQALGERVVVLDEIYERDIITQDMIPRVTAHPLWPYVRGGVIDQAARQRQANLSVHQIWAQTTGHSFRTNYVYIQDGIDAVRYRLRMNGPDGLPLMVFNSSLSLRRTWGGNAGGILTELQLWCWSSNATTSLIAPLNKNNDAAKALAYYVFDRYGSIGKRGREYATRTRPGWRQRA